MAAVHASFNIIGSAVCLVLFYGGDLLFDFSFMNMTVGAVGIAACHTVFNLFTTAILLPFTNQLERLAQRLVKDEDKRQEFAFLDPLLLRTPAVAIAECESMTNRMGALARKNLYLAMQQLDGYSEKRETEIAENEDKLDIYEDKLGQYLVQISRKGVSSTNMRTVSRLLHAIGDFERVGDHAVNLQESARELQDKGLHFSPAAAAELDVVKKALDDIVETAFAAFRADDMEKARHVEPLEETIDHLIEEIRQRHVLRLQSGECTIQLGFVLNDLLANMERVSDHCSNIALSVIQEKTRGFNPHAYSQEIKGESEFRADLVRARDTYRLPQ